MPCFLSEREVVAKKNWLTEEEFTENVSRSTNITGPVSVNSSVLSDTRKRDGKVV